MRSGPVARYTVLQIVNLKLAWSFFIGVLSTRSSRFEIYRNDVISKVANTFFLIFFNMINWCFLGKSKQSNQMCLFAWVFLASRHCQSISCVVKISTTGLQQVSRLSWRLILHFNLGINSLLNRWIVNYSSLEQEIHVNLIVLRACLLFKQKQIDYVSHLFTLLHFESSDRFTSLFVGNQIPARLIIKSVKHYFACSIF